MGDPPLPLIRSLTGAPQPQPTGNDANPPAGGAGTGTGAPASGDRYEWRTLGTSYFSGGDFLGALGGLFTDGVRIRSVETEVQELETRARTATGPALGETMDRLTRLRQVLNSLHTLDRLDIHRSDFNALRRTAVDRLLAGTERPPRETEYQAGLGMLRDLQRYQTLEARREQFVAQVEALYPQPHDDRILFRLDYSGLRDADLDAWNDPSVASLNNLRVIQTYRTLANSSDPNDRRIAGVVRDLFERLRNHTGAFAAGGGGPATLEALNAASTELEGVFRNPDLQAFFQRIGSAERDAMLANEGSRVRLNTTESLAMMQQYPGLMTALSRYDVLVGATRPLEEQQSMLADSSRVLIRRGEQYLRFLRAQPAGADRDRDIASIESGLGELRGIEGSLNTSGLTRDNLSALAARMAPVARTFQPFEERNLRDALTRMIRQVEQLPSSENNIQPIRDALAAITDTVPATPADRLAAFRRVGSMIDQATTVRLIDARLSILQQQLDSVGTHHTVVQIGLGMDDSPNAGETFMDYREAAGESEARFTRMIGEYRRIRGLVTSTNAADAARGRRELQQLEGAAMQGTLANEAEFAQTMNMITIGAGIILVAALTAEFGGLALAAGAESLFATTTLSVATQEFLVGAIYYSSMTVIFTGVSRGLNERAFGPQANQHGFFTDLLINAVMFGVVGGAMRGVGRAINGYVERLAVANLERAGGLVLAREGGETMSRFAMDTASRAAVEQEMARIMDTFAARLGTGAATLSTEYVMFNLFELSRTAVELRLRGDSDPVGHAAAAVLSPKGQARIAAFLVAMRALNSVAEPFAAPIRDRLGNILGEGLLNARMRELERNVADLSREWSEGRITDPLEMMTRSRALLEQRQRILMEANARETMPSEDLSREFAANERALQQLDRVVDFLRGVDRVFGEGNAFGVADFSGDGSVFTYRPGQAQRIVDALNGLPGGVDRANVRAHPNGMIEVPFLASPFIPEARTVFLIPANTAGRRPSGSAIVVRPAAP